MHASQDTPFDQYILAMQTTADAPAASYNAATQASMRAKIDRAGKMKLHTLTAKFNAFCDTNDLDRMKHADRCECYLRRPASRKKLVNGVLVFDPPFTTVDPTRRTRPRDA